METPKRLIQELITKNATIIEAQDIIDDAISKYQKAIAMPKQIVENCGKRIKEIKNTTLTVGLEDLVEQVADTWNVDANLLDIGFKFVPKYTNYPCSQQEFIDWQTGIDNIFSIPFNIEFDVCFEDEHQRKTLCFLMPLSLQAFESVQKDGRMLKECLKFICRPTTEVEGYPYENTFECDNYKNLNFSFKINYLLDRDNELTEKGKIIIKAYEKENKIEKEF